MITKLRVLVASLVVAGASTAALAHGGGKGMRHHGAMLEKFDANKDGKLDDAEKAAMRNARIEQRFARLDANKDGAISLAEMKAAKLHGKHGRHGMK